MAKTQGAPIAVFYRGDGGCSPRTARRRREAAAIAAGSTKPALTRLLLLTALVAAASTGAASGAAPAPWKPVRLARQVGPVSAVLTMERQAHGEGFFTFRKLRLVLRVHGETVVNRALCNETRCGAGSHHSLALQNVWGSALPEAVVGIYTGGAHCCFDTLVAFPDGALRGRVVEHDFGDPGYRGVRHDGSYQFVTADDRFAYAFTSFAGSGLPVQVLELDPAGRFADVTAERLDLVRADAKVWWRAYTSQRGRPDGDVRGVLAAWCADEYRLGEGAACRSEVARARLKGWLGGPGDLWPSGAKFVTALDRSLKRWGYVS